jgi:hypothetical protein
VYGILGEHASDTATLKVLVRRLAGAPVKIKGKGYSGCAEMLRKGARQLRLFQNLGYSRFIVCHDADGPDPAPAREKVASKIIRPSGIRTDCCIVVPVQELEAWILADIECAVKIFPSWKPAAIDNPERIENPKEYLERLSRDSRQKSRYSHATHNEHMAKYLNLENIRHKCPSFRELTKFVA